MTLKLLSTPTVYKSWQSPSLNLHYDGRGYFAGRVGGKREQETEREERKREREDDKALKMFGAPGYGAKI